MTLLWQNFTGQVRETNLLYYWTDEPDLSVEAWCKRNIASKVRKDEYGWFALFAQNSKIDLFVDRGVRSTWNHFRLRGIDAQASVYIDFPAKVRGMLTGKWDISFVSFKDVILRVEKDEDAILLRLSGVEDFILEPIA